MKHLIEFPLEEGGSIVVEIEEPEMSGTVHGARGDTVAKARETLEDALDKVLPAAKGVFEKLHRLDDKPNEVEVAFGIKLNTSLGAVIASATAEANFGVTLRWSRNTKDQNP